jgi:regulator of replication initiation timing
MSEQIVVLLENFKKEVFQKFDNLQSQIDNLQSQVDNLNCQVTVLSARKNEIFYQKHLEKLLNGSHQKTKHGYTDITTHDAIYEIKRWNDYKSCFGQLKSYSVGNEHKRLCAAFFGVIPPSKKQEIISLFF